VQSQYQSVAQPQISSLQQHLNRNPQQLILVILLSKRPRTGDHFINRTEEQT